MRACFFLFCKNTAPFWRRRHGVVTLQFFLVRSSLLAPQAQFGRFAAYSGRSSLLVLQAHFGRLFINLASLFSLKSKTPVHT